MRKNLVAIVGRPNVGKSTLVNKLIGKRSSIVYDEEGVTRDRLYYDVEWVGNKFEIIDTGGISIEGKPFQEQIKTQAEIAIEEAEVIAMVVDGLEGLNPDDEYIISILRKSGKKVLILANKLEGNREIDYSICSSGFDVYPISAIHGEGIGDVLDTISSYLDFSNVETEQSRKLAIIGKPNAGKSSLLNSLFGEERAIVSPIAGTTRDSVKAEVDINGEMYHVVDTAGISKKSKLIESVDHYALGKAKASLAESDLTLLVIDATKELSHFDARIAGYAMEEMKPIILVINKWDLIKKNTNTMHEFEKKVRKEFKFLSWAPVVFISAINSSRLDRLKNTINMVNENLTKRIKTSLLNEMILDIQMMQPAPSFNGGRFNISFLKQVEAAIPTFVLFANNKNYAHFTYLRYVENQFREYFGFEGTPIKLIVKNKNGGGAFNDK
ncbi:ribosome biogenesis GTPase Der [Mycoplasma marinum]|uniref:GTPase Der n=1 Tax=Mycoplasma marinum TaxID=1937190 RepID=A0A4R0XMQ4_9MOLU|nr:ribosome biogenesis GTPase Der [Mycoplasma marinum]TCG12004.1 ribosome biogenesis GTPase Der [Mycoplasma marinum]